MPWNFFSSGTLFWGGLGAASIPIIIHILNRRRFQRVRWAAMAFLLQAEKITRKRVRIEHLILLLIRTLAVLLIAWALASPQGCSSTFLGEGGRNIVVVLDDSYSMGHTNDEGISSFDRARKHLDRLGKGLRGGDQVTLIRTSDAYRWSRTKDEMEGQATASVEDYLYLSHVKVDQSTEQTILDKLGRLEPSDIHTDYFLAFQLLKADADRLDDTELFGREVVVLTDMRAFGWTRRAAPSRGADNAVDTPSQNETFKELLVGLTGEVDNPHRANVTLIDVGEPVNRNISIESVVVDEPGIPVIGARIAMKVTLLNRGNTPETDIEVTRRVNGEKKETLKANLEPGASRALTFEFVLREPGPYSIEFVVADSLEADSHYYYPLNLREGIRVLMIDGEATGPKLQDTETYLLSRALFPQREDPVGSMLKEDIVLPPEIKDDLNKAADLEKYDLVILANTSIGAGDLDKVAALERYVADGGAVWIFLGSKVATDDFNRTLYADGKGLSPVKLSAPIGNPQNEDGYWELAPGAVRHPTLALLHKAGLFESATYAPHVRRRFPLILPELVTPNAVSTPLFFYRQPGGPPEAPAVVIREYNNAGVVALFSFTADGAWTNFLTNKHKVLMSVPFLHILIRYATLRHDRIDPRDVFAGDPIAMNFDPRKPPTQPQLKIPEDSEEAAYSAAGDFMQKIPRGQDPPIPRFAYRDTYETGRYLVRDKDVPPAQIFAANVFLTESNMERVTAGDLRAALPEFTFRMRDTLKNVSVAGKSRWKDFAYIVLGLLIVESILAAIFSRPSVKT